MKNKPLPLFIISAPTMVFGMDLVENVEKLSQVVTHSEIVLFQTPDLHNIPDEQTITTVKEIMAEKNMTCSVHLPASLEVAAEDIRKRNSAVQTTVEMVEHLDKFNPTNYVLHVPVSTPLTAQPGCYVYEHQLPHYAEWSERALRALEEIQTRTGLNHRLLVENINFSPAFLEPLWREGLCAFCLDIGHLLLGRESAGHYLRRYLPVIKEIHLHGVIEWDEHLSLDVLPMERVRAWLQVLEKFDFTGILNLEVFSPPDLEKSMRMVAAALST